MDVHYLQTRLPGVKRKDIQGLTHHGFNGSILPYKGGYLLAYRDDTEWRIQSVRLNSRFEVETPVVSMGLYMNTDPRLFYWMDRVWMTTSYCGGPGPAQIEAWPMTVEPALNVDDDWMYNLGGYHFKFTKVHDFPGYQTRAEKNWAPFLYRNHLHYVYSWNPHRILRVSFRDKAAQLVASTPFDPLPMRPRDITEVRLSTPPVLLPDGTYLSTWHYRSRWFPDYYSGFYRFEGEPPWKVIDMSGAPVFTPGMAHNTPQRYPMSCVFLSAMVVDGDVVTLSGGVNDTTVPIFTMSLKEILGSLRKVK